MKTYNSTTNRKGAVEYTKRNEFEYTPNHSKAVLFFGLVIVLAVALLIAGITKAKADGNTPLDYSDVGCKPYTYGMVTGHQAAAMTHSPCNDSGRIEKNDKEDAAESAIELPVTEDTAAVEPVVTEEPIVTPPAVEPTEAPTVERKQKCNKGEGNGSEGCDPGNHPELGNDDENNTTPREDKSTGSLGFASFIFVTFRIGRGKKEYFATVSSWHYHGKNLWLYIWPDKEKNVMGMCGYVVNGKVTASSMTLVEHPYLTDETLKTMSAWG
jgi:hypothetical protein